MRLGAVLRYRAGNRPRVLPQQPVICLTCRVGVAHPSTAKSTEVFRSLPRFEMAACWKTYAARQPISGTFQEIFHV